MAPMTNIACSFPPEIPYAFLTEPDPLCSLYSLLVWNGMGWRESSSCNRLVLVLYLKLFAFVPSRGSLEICMVQETLAILVLKTRTSLTLVA